MRWGAVMNYRAARHLLASLALVALPACAAIDAPAHDLEETIDHEDAAAAWRLTLGARRDSTGAINFRLFSSRATRVTLELYKGPRDAAPAMVHELTGNAETDIWATSVPAAALEAAGLGGTVYYGYRAWGPNWPYQASWTPGSLAGFVADVDAEGNRFNPNKLLLDPYALEVSHDPEAPEHRDGTVYGTGPDHRAKNSGPMAPKGIVVNATTTGVGTRPTRPFKDEVIYEVHLRGFTRNDPSVPAALRGTYAGAGRKAAYLKSIGVTAVELLPVQETQNETNDVAQGTQGDNYWGYMTLSYFAPDRRYAADRTPGGPTREFKDMVAAFHAEGIKVYTDVVYNHTGEGGLWDASGNVASLLSMRGLDNAAYYELAGDKRFYYDNTGCGANFNTAGDAARDLVVDSLWYWQTALGVDGFRFDLASVLGNTCESGCFNFDKMDPANVMNRSVAELPVRPAEGGAGVDLIAEPWAIGGNSYQVGNFPSGWAEWNGAYRDTLRKDQNQMGVEPVTPGELATRIAGSSDLFADDGRRPFHSVNFLVAHDGFTLRDLYAYNGKNNGQAWPFGPSDGGEDTNRSWDQGGDPAAQRQAARTGLALLMLSAGVPMITGGDERYRTQYGNNNAYNLDSDKNWLNWSPSVDTDRFASFARRLIRFRGAHAAFRPASFFTGSDRNGDGLKDITWLRDDGGQADAGYMGAPDRHFLGYRIDGAEAGDSVASVYVAYNGWSGKVTATLPAPRAGRSWYRAGDTAGWMEGAGNFADPGQEARLDGGTYDLAGRSVLILIEK
jgi:isoamylase